MSAACLVFFVQHCFSATVIDGVPSSGFYTIGHRLCAIRVAIDGLPSGLYTMDGVPSGLYAIDGMQSGPYHITVPHCTVLYHTISYCTALYLTVPYCTIPK